MPNTIEEETTVHTCRHCGDDYEEVDGYDEDFCSSGCYDDYHYERDSGEELDTRKWGKNAVYLSSVAGDIVRYTRGFSVEIETYYPDTYTANRVAYKLPREVGISGDGSLGDNGIEYQTPVMSGIAGENLVRDICDTLNSNNYRVDRSCGLHVHIDGKGLLPSRRTKGEAQTVKNLLKLYVSFEDVIQSFLPRSRRNNSYARHVRNTFSLNGINDCYTLESVEKMWYKVAKRSELKKQKDHHYNQTRYNGLNLHSLFSDGHLEIRYHSGTINAEKILHWVSLHLSLVEYAKMYRSMPNVNEYTDIKEKTAYMFDLLNTPQTTRDYYAKRQALFNPSSITEDSENS